MRGIFLVFLFLGACAGPKIIDRPINFNENRKNLSLQYMRDRYGLEKEEPGIQPEIVVVHWTAIPDLEASYRAFEDPQLPGNRKEISGAGSLNVSSHFLVDRNGKIYRLMPETMMARHVIGLNHVAIGIENVGGPEARLTREQLTANEKLIRYLNKKYNINYLIGHYEYQLFEGHHLWLEKDKAYRTQKTDPGNEFMQDLRAKLQDLNFKPLPNEN